MENDSITARTLNWAWSHDWGQEAWLGKDGVLNNLTDTSVSANGEVLEQRVSFASRHELRAWAGY